jgi:hypothetical protein
VAAPELLSVQVVTLTEGNQAVQLDWSHDGVNLTGFDIERNTLHKNGRITATTVLAVTDQDLRSYTDDVGSGRYSYRIRARNGNETSAWSDMSAVMTVSDGGGGGGGGKGGGKPNK